MNAQSVAINTNGDTANKSAILDVSSTSKGVLIPRMTMTERNAIASPAESLLVFQTDNSPGYYYFDGVSWVHLIQSTNKDTCMSLIPQPTFPVSSGGLRNQSSNTTASFGQILVPFQLTVKEVSINCGIVNDPGVMKIALYSENGQVKIFEFSTNTILSPGIITTQLNLPVTIPAGIYYISTLPTGSTNVNLESYGSGVISSQYLHITGKNVLIGTINVAPDALPTSFNPSLITFSDFRCITFKFN